MDQILAVYSPLPTEDQQKNQEASRPSEEATSDPPAAPLKRHHSLKEEQKRCFFHILKRLLQEPFSLKAGEWDEETHEGNTFRLVYQKENCEVSILDAKGQVQLHDTLATLDVYLKWGKGVKEPLSLDNLQRVQNELRFLGIQNEKVNACFSLARNEFVQESAKVQNYCTLQIICEDVNWTFSCPPYFSNTSCAVTVLYNNTKNTAAYYFRNLGNDMVECRYG